MKKIFILKSGRQIAMSFLHGSRDEPYWAGRERRNNTDLTHGEKLGLGVLDSLLENSQHSEEGLLHKIEQGDRVILYGYTRRPGLWGAAGSRGQVELIRGSSLWVVHILREKAMVDIFCTAININTPEEDSSIPSWVSLPRGRRLCYFPLRWWSAWGDVCLGQQHTFNQGFPQALLCPLQKQWSIFLQLSFLGRRTRDCSHLRRRNVKDPVPEL